MPIPVGPDTPEAGLGIQPGLFTQHRDLFGASGMPLGVPWGIDKAAMPWFVSRVALIRPGRIASRPATSGTLHSPWFVANSPLKS